MVLDTILLDEQDLRKCTLVAPVVPVEESTVEVPDEGMNDSRNLVRFDEPAIPVLDAVREVNGSKQSSEEERRKRNLTQVLHVPWRTICCRARTIDDPHPAVIRGESFVALPKIECCQGEIKMKRDTTPIKVFLVVDSSTGCLEPLLWTNKVVYLVFCCEMDGKVVGSIGYARMTEQSDTEHVIEHLLEAVNGLCAADLIVQKAPVKSHASPGHAERAVRLVENQYRAIPFDVQ